MHELINGSHYTDYGDYYEWWYFHFLSEDGFAANIVLHETDIFGLSRESYVSMSFCLSNGEPQYYKIKLFNGDIERNTKYLSVVDNLFYETMHSINIFVYFQKDVSFKAVIKKISFPLVINSGILYCGLDADKSSYWVPFVPKGSYEGILTVNNIEHRLQGFAYHDHQWGNILIQDFVHDWVWGNFCNQEASVIFFEIKTKYGGKNWAHIF